MRISNEEWAIGIAVVTAKRSTCLRRHVGCVMLDEQWRVLSTGFNGVARGQKHCNDHQSVDPQFPKDYRFHNGVNNYPHACPGAGAVSGTNLDGCLAIHAEQNALLQCRDPDKIHTCVVTTSPCMTCTKLLLNTGCRRILYLEEYPHATARELWMGSGREWVEVTLTKEDRECLQATLLQR